MKSMRRLWKPSLAWLIVLPFIWLATRDVPIQQGWKLLTGLSLAQIVFLAILNAGIFLLISSRWWLILRALGYRRPYSSLVGYRLAGFGLNYFTPGPQIGGEPLQVYLVRSRQAVPYSTAVASVTLDKLFELLSNFSFLAIGVLFLLERGLFGASLHWQVLGLILALAALPAGYLVSLWSGRLPLTALLKQLNFPWRKLSKLIQLVYAAEKQAASFCRMQPMVLLQALGLSMAIWAAMLFEFWLSLRFLGLPPDPLLTIALLTAARVAFLLPVPAGLGTLEAGLLLALRALGIPPAFGISLSLLIRARDVSFAGLGLWLAALSRTAVRTETSPAGD